MAAQKLTAEQVKAIRRRYVPREITVRHLALDYGVHFKTIWRIVKGQRRRAVA